MPRFAVLAMLGVEIWRSVEENDQQKAAGFKSKHVPVYCTPSGRCGGNHDIGYERAEKRDGARELEAAWPSVS